MFIIQDNTNTEELVDTSNKVHRCTLDNLKNSSNKNSDKNYMNVVYFRNTPIILYKKPKIKRAPLPEPIFKVEEEK